MFTQPAFGDESVRVDEIGGGVECGFLGDPGPVLCRCESDD